MPTIRLTPTTLIVTLTRFERLGGLLPNLEIPLSDVRGATHDDGILRDIGMRAPGLAWPRRALIGTFRKWKFKDYVVWRNEPQLIVISLTNQRWERLVIGVRDAEPLVQQINTATA